VNPTATQIRELRAENLRHGLSLREIPFSEWPAVVLGTKAIAVWRSRQYLVQVFEEQAGMIRLSVNRTDWDERAKRFRDDISWDALQRLKAQAGYADRVAVEVYPPDRLIVNVANMRHLWILPVGSERLPFVWRGGNT